MPPVKLSLLDIVIVTRSLSVAVTGTHRNVFTLLSQPNNHNCSPGFMISCFKRLQTECEQTAGLEEGPQTFVDSVSNGQVVRREKKNAGQQ